MTIWFIIFGVGLFSLFLRASSLVLLRNRKLPASIVNALGLVPAAVLSAIVLPDLLIQHGEIQPLNARLFAGFVAGVVAWKTRNMLWTLLVGLGLLFAAQALGWN